MKGRIIVVGMGPGAEEMMTAQADAALRQCDLIVGYSVYTDLLRERYPDKEFYANGMRRELERCAYCLEQARSGKTVVLVCSGDAGVYGMASPMLGLAAEEGFEEVEVVAGVTAASAGAALLGAPIGHDFCVISLSDLLTPWKLIEKRLLAAAEGDFCIVIYNPSSHKRPDHLKRACDILLQKLPPKTCCGYVRNIGREGCEKHVCSLEELREAQTDMFVTVFIGNSQTCMEGGRLVTPRGYRT